MECHGKVLVDDGEGFLEFLFTDLIELLDTRLPQVLALGIIAGALDLVLASFFAEIAELLPRHAESIVHPRRADTSLVELPLHLDAARFQAFFLGAQRFHLTPVIRGLRRKLFLLL